MKKHLPALLTVILFALGCASTETVESTKIKPEEIYQEYSISGTDRRVAITATFRVGDQSGATIDLDAPSKIEADGGEMKEIAPSFAKGTTYSAFAETYAPRHVFELTAPDGKVYRNEITLEKLQVAAAGGFEIISLSRTQPSRIPLSRKVAASERVSISLVSDNQQPPSPTRNVAPPSNAGTNNAADPNAPAYSLSRTLELDGTRTALLVEPWMLKNFAPGGASLKVETLKEEPVREGTKRGGTLKFAYESPAVRVNVIN